MEAFASGGAATVRFDVGLATNNAGGGFYRIGETKSFSIAELNSVQTSADPDGSESLGLLNQDSGAASAILIPLRPLELDLNNTPEGKFVSLRAVETGSAALTQGKVQAWLTIAKDTGVQGLKHFHRSGFTV